MLRGDKRDRTHGRHVAVNQLGTMTGTEILSRPAVDIHKIFNQLRSNLSRTVSAIIFVAIDKQLEYTENELGWFIYLRNVRQGVCKKLMVYVLKPRAFSPVATTSDGSRNLAESVDYV